MAMNDARFFGCQQHMKRCNCVNMLGCLVSPDSKGLMDITNMDNHYPAIKGVHPIRKGVLQGFFLEYGASLGCTMV